MDINTTRCAGKLRDCITELCEFINYLENCGCLTDEDKNEYCAIIEKYNS